MFRKSFLLLILFVSIAGCSGGMFDTDGGYVFDDVASDTTFIQSSQWLLADSAAAAAEKREATAVSEAAAAKSPANKISVQAGAFRSTGKADRLAGMIRSRYNRKTEVLYNSSAGLYLLRVTGFKDRGEAGEFVSALKKNKIEAFIVRDK